MINPKIIELLEKKNIEFTELANWGQYLRSVWEENYAFQLTSDEKKNIYLEQYLWHVFSYKKVPCLKNEQAIKEFNRVIKEQCTCHIFFQRSNFALTVQSCRDITAEDIMLDDDIYIVDTEFNWTFVKTHEEQCGPYFAIRIENMKNNMY